MGVFDGGRNVVEIIIGILIAMPFCIMIFVAVIKKLNKIIDEVVDRTVLKNWEKQEK